LKLCFISGLISCASKVPKEFEPKLWQADNEKAAIVRNQALEEIKCSDVKFNEYVCMTWQDFLSIIEKCREKSE